MSFADIFYHKIMMDFIKQMFIKAYYAKKTIRNQRIAPFLWFFLYKLKFYTLFKG